MMCRVKSLAESPNPNPSCDHFFIFSKILCPLCNSVIMFSFSQFFIHLLKPVEFLENLNASVQQARHVTDTVVVQEKAFVTHLKMAFEMRPVSRICVCSLGKKCAQSPYLCHCTAGDKLRSDTFFSVFCRSYFWHKTSCRLGAKIVCTR